MKAIQASKLKGKTITAADGTEVGEVEEVHIDPSSWKVTALQVRVRRGVLEKLQVDQPVFGQGKSLLLDPAHVDRVADDIHVTDDIWDIGLQRWV